MTVYPDNSVTPALAKMLACFEDEVRQSPDFSPDMIIGFRTGTSGQALAGLSADECCAGAAFLRVIRTFPSWSAPNESSVSITCAQPQAVEVELSMWRCGPIGDIENPPSQDDWNELHTGLLTDRQTMRATACCIYKLWGQRNVRIGPWAPIPTEGGCVGSSLTVEVDLFRGGTPR